MAKNFNQNNFNQNNQNQMQNLPEDFKKTCFIRTYQYLLNITQEKTPLDDVFNDIEKFVSDKCKSLTTTQLRNIYGKITEVNQVSELKMLRPNLAYVAARQNNAQARDIVKFFDGLIREVQTEEQLNSFKKVMEAVVAYHKFHNGNKK